MANTIALISTLLVAFFTLLIFIGMMGAVMDWFYSGMLVGGSALAAVLCAGVLAAVLPYYER